MKTYLILYRVDAAAGGPSVSEMFANTPPDQLAAGMAMWQAWSEKCGASMLNMGAPLDNSILVQAAGASPNKSTITGFSVLEAESSEACVELMKGHPHFFAPGASVEILESVSIPGM